MRKSFFIFSMLMALVAFVLLIADGAASITGGQITCTSGEQFLTRLFSPQSIERFQTYVTSKAHVLVWRTFKVMFLTPPALLVAGALSLICYLPTRRIGRLPLRIDRSEA